MPVEVLDQVWRAVGLVPTYLIDADSRAAAARRLFDARKRPACVRAANVAHGVVQRVIARLDEGHVPLLAARVQARSSAPGWQSLPALSLALALAARLAARGDETWARLLDDLCATWAGLARQAPDLVELDLVLAECLVLGATL
jgi:hypothetical protein